MACLYNMKSSHLQLLDDSDMISPMSTVQSTPVSFSAQPAVVSPADTRSTYFTDEKCAMPIQAYDGIEVVPEQPRRPSRGLEVVLQHPPGYSVGGAQVNYINADAELPARSNLVPFWRRYLLLIIAGIFLLLIIIAGVAVGINKAKANGSVSKAANGSLAGSNTTSSTELGVTNTTSVAKLAVTNSTRDSVASSGLWLKDGTFNKYLFNQKSSGRITLQVSLDGETYEDYQNVTLTIPPKVGSPLSATAEEDSQTGVVMINLFYLSGDKTVSNVTMSAITCPANSASCNTINNCLLPTKIPTLVYTGLAAINVNNAQDWRVYYLDQEGAVSQLMGNGSGFDEGVKIGGTGLNTSSMAAVNYNMSTNNINLFYVDALTKNLFKMQYTGLTDNGWTTRKLSFLPLYHPSISLTLSL